MIKSANQAFTNFKETELGRSFAGEIFAIGDHLGGLLLYESLKQINKESVSRHSSSVSANSHVISDEKVVFFLIDCSCFLNDSLTADCFLISRLGHFIFICDLEWFSLLFIVFRKFSKN